MVGRVRGSTPRGGTAGGPLGSSVVGSPSSSCRGPRGCVGEQPTARRAPRIAPACFPRVIPAPPSSPPAPPLLPLTLPSFWQTFCLLNVDFFSFYMVAQGASPVPVPVPPTLALPSRRPSPKRRYARRSPCGHRRRLCSRPPLAHALWLARVRRDPFARCARARRARRTTSAAPTTPQPLLAGGPRTTPPHTPSPITHTLLSIHIHPHNSLHPLPSAPLVTPLPSTPAQVSPWSCLGYGVV